MSRDRGWRRKKNWSKAFRKKKLAYWWHYKYDGQYIKGKIHCSCPLCGAKTNNKKNLFYCGHRFWKPSDQIKVDKMDAKEAEWNGEV